MDNVSPLDEVAGGTPAGAARGDPPEHSRRRLRGRRAGRALLLRRLMPVRVGAVSYLNARPLVRGLERSPERFAVRFDLPSRVRRCCTRARSISGSFRPSSTSAARLRVVPGIGVVSDGPVASVAMFTRVPVGRHPLACTRHQLPHVGGADQGDVRAVLRHRAGVLSAGPDLAAMVAGPTRRCSSATRRCFAVRAAGPREDRSRRGVEGDDGPAVRVRVLGRGAGRPHTRGCRACCRPRGMRDAANPTMSPRSISQTTPRSRSSGRRTAREHPLSTSVNASVPALERFFALAAEIGAAPPTRPLRFYGEPGSADAVAAAEPAGTRALE